MGERRPLGGHEWVLHFLHVFGSLITLVALHVRGSLDPDDVARALSWLQHRHPMLRAHISHGRPVFHPVPPFVYLQPYFDTNGTRPIDLRVARGDWSEIMTGELGLPMRRGRRPRLRVTLVPDGGTTHVIIASDHSSIDAKSCNLLSRELLEYLADPAACEARPIVEQHLPPTCEAGLPKKSDSGSKAHEPTIRLPRRPEPRAGRRGTRVVSRRIAEHRARAIKATAREKGATLHGTITGAFLLAIRERFGLEAMTCLSSVDLRRFSNPPVAPDTFGCFIDVLRTRHEISSDFWRNAREASFRLISAIAKDQQTASILKLPAWGIYRVELAPLIVNQWRLDGLAVTTADDSGLAERYGDLTLEGMTMGVSLGPVAPSLMVICCERLGGFDISVNYPAHLLSTEEAIQLTEDAMAILERAVDPALATVA